MKKEDFLKDVQNWNNHLYLLWPALETTKKKVVEFGMGDGSTPFLHEYCKDNNRELLSYENNLEWMNKFKKFEKGKHKINFVENWEDVELDDIGVLLIDHAPGERRWEDIKKYANRATCIVIHDSEPAATGYMLDKIWGLFKYRKDYKTEGAWASIVSNVFDVSKLEV